MLRWKQPAARGERGNRCFGRAVACYAGAVCAGAVCAGTADPGNQTHLYEARCRRQLPASATLAEIHAASGGCGCAAKPLCTESAQPAFTSSSAQREETGSPDGFSRMLSRTRRVRGDEKALSDRGGSRSLEATAGSLFVSCCTGAHEHNVDWVVALLELCPWL